jgi:serine/threonine protein kinase/tetratricopeptide (TPR) repeat protein
MTLPRKPDAPEPALLPDATANPATQLPDQTAAYAVPVDATVDLPAPVVRPPAEPPLRPPANASASVTEVDATGAYESAEAGTGEATHVHPGRTQSPDATVAIVPRADEDSPEASGTVIGRFAVRELYAKGGLGEVFLARDTELNREVALKRIQSRYADDPVSRRRFLSEAELTARLDHPGVVPVFGLVVDGHGRPCYAMRLIRGETLKDEIDRYHRGTPTPQPATDQTEKSSTRSGDPSPAGPRPPTSGTTPPRSVAFRNLLQRFIAVCQAIGYAHTRRIIHRDIKPANVMVGTFGETLVVDWGLAKSLDDDPDVERMLKTAAEAGFRHDPEATELPSHVTAAGTAIGTPSYMAPEQAAGQIERVGPLSDVYSLGATLFAILTGKAPFSGTVIETLDKVRRGDFPAPAAVNAQTPRPLDAICRKAMALRPEDRYQSALELAADVERWLSDEPVSCYRDRWPARLARWSRRHPAQIAAAGSLLVAGVLAAGSLAWAINEGHKNTQIQRDRAIEAEQATAAALDRVTLEQSRTAAALAQVTQEQQKTEAARAVARARYDLAVAAFNTLVTDIQRQLADRAGTQEMRQRLLQQAQHGLKALLEGAGADRIGADRTLVAAHRQMGEVYQLLGNTRAARQELAAAVRMAATIHAANPDATATRDLAQALVKLAELQLQAGNSTAAQSDCESAIELYRGLLDSTTEPEAVREELAAAQDELAEILLTRGQSERAATLCRDALHIRRQAAQAAPDDLEVNRRLGDSLARSVDILVRAGRTTDAQEAAIECVRVRNQVFAKAPSRPDVRREVAAGHATLGTVLLDRGGFAEAHKEFTTARDVLTNLVSEDPRNALARSALAGVLGRLGVLKLRTGELATALKDVTAANELCQQLERADPESAKARRELAFSQEELGTVLLAQGRVADALASFRRSAELLRPLEQADPDAVRAKYELARSLERVGEGLLASGAATDAVIALTESVVLRELVANVDRDSARAKRELAVGLSWLAEAYRSAGRPIAARSAITGAVTRLRQVADVDTTNTAIQRELAAATGTWGEILAQTQRPTMALTAAARALDQFRTLADRDPANIQAKADLAAAWERLGAIYATQGQADAAGRAARTALELRTQLAREVGETKTARRELAVAMIRVADTASAVRQFETARKWYRSARQLVAPDPIDPQTTTVANLADEKLALLDAVDLLTRDPANGLARVPAGLQLPALRSAVEWLIAGGQPITASTLAGQLADLSSSPDDRYLAAWAMARCADSPTITEPLRAAYAAEAVKFLERAVAAGFTNAEALTGKDWDPCRALPTFQQLVQSLATAMPVAPLPRGR